MSITLTAQTVFGNIKVAPEDLAVFNDLATLALTQPESDWFYPPTFAWCPTWSVAFSDQPVPRICKIEAELHGKDINITFEDVFAYSVETPESPNDARCVVQDLVKTFYQIKQRNGYTVVRASELTFKLKWFNRINLQFGSEINAITNRIKAAIIKGGPQAPRVRWIYSNCSARQLRPSSVHGQGYQLEDCIGIELLIYSLGLFVFSNNPEYGAHRRYPGDEYLTRSHAFYNRCRLERPSDDTTIYKLTKDLQRDNEYVMNTSVVEDMVMIMNRLT